MTGGIPKSLLERLRRLYPNRRPKSLGQRGEQVAARYLRRRGFKIVERGVRGALGEIDLVAVHRRTVVFV